MKKQIKKSVLSAVLALSFLASVFFIPSASVKASGGIPTSFGENLLTGLSMTARYSLDGSSFINAPDNGKFKSINDGDLSTEFFLGTPKFAEKIGGETVYYKDGSKVFLDMTFDMGLINEVKALYMLNHASSSLRTARYKIYLSEEESELFKSDSLKKDYENTELLEENLITFDSAISARYFGIRILNPTCGEVEIASTYTRILELALLGKKGEKPSISGSNVLKGVSMRSRYSTDGETILPLSDNGIYKRINDGDKTTECFIGTPKFAEAIGGSTVYYKDGSKVFLDLFFDLGEPFTLSGLTMINNASSSLRTNRFKVYVASSEEELFEAKSLVGDIQNDGNLEEISYIFPKKKDAQYFGIRILNPISNESVTAPNAYTRIMELMLFGEAQKSNVSVVSSDFTASEKEIKELKSSQNILYNKDFMEITQWNEGEDTSSNAKRQMLANPKALTNAIANNAAFFPGAIYFKNGEPKNKAPYSDPEAYTTISYDLGGRATLNSVWIYNHSKKDLSSYVYEVYISDSNITLFDDASLVKRFINAKSETKQELNFETPIKGRYLGIKFLVPVPLTSAAGMADRYVRMSQIAAFGTVEAAAQENYYSSLKVSYEFNLLKNIEPEVIGFNGSKEEVISGKFSALTDENFENENIFPECEFADYNGGNPKIYEDGERYLKLTFDIKTVVEAFAAAIVNHPTKNNTTKKYELYGSDDKETLYNSENLIKSYDNEAGERVNIFEFQSPTTFRYLGIKVIDPAFGELKLNSKRNEYIARFSDIAVFGKYTDPNHKINNPQGIINLTQEEFDAFGESLIKGQKTPKWYYNGATIPGPWAYVEQSAILTDGDLSAHSDFTTSKWKLSTTDGSNYLDVAYEFDKLHDISGFTFLGISTPASMSYYTGWYQVYVGEELDELFLPENMVFEYNWKTDGEYRGHHVEFENYKARGIAFGIRILSPVTTATMWPIPRLSEIAVYGEEAIIEVKPTNLAANMPLEALTEDKKGNLEEITESNLSLKERKKLTDMSEETEAEIKTSKDIVHLNFNLCNDVRLNELKLISNAKKYKVYASDNIEKVWDESSLIYSYKGGKNGKTLSGKAANKKYRYIRFEITDFGDELKIKEVNIIGGDNQLLKYKQISRTFGQSNATIASYNYETGQHKFYSYDTYFYKLFDSDTLTSINLEGGKHHKETIDLIVTFDDVKNIDKVSLHFPDMLDGYNPTKLELYSSERLDAFDTGEIKEKPIKIFNGLPKDGVYSVSFKPRFARILLIRFVAGNEEYDGYEHMCFAMNEIDIRGTAVVGIQPDEKNPALLTFKDKETGISVDILKYDRNDIFTEVSSIEVVEEEATLEQKKALAESGQLKIADEKVYRVRLKNSFGKTITDIGGRRYKISIPYDEDKFNYPMMAAGSKNCATLNSDVVTGLVYYETDSFSDDKFMLAVFANSDDPYFENLGAEIPGIFIPDYDYSEDSEISDDVLSPETGEESPIVAIIISLLAMSAFAIACAAKKEKE